jgi:hypothetical protein
MTPERFRQIESLYHAARERTGLLRAELLAQVDPELRREVVKNMRRIAQPVQKQDGLSFPAPIQIMKPDTAYRDKFGFMW